MGNSTSVEPAPPPEQLGFGTMLFYLWLFYCAIKIVNNASDGKLLKKKKKKDKNDNDPLKKVIGLESVKEEIKYYMDFINNKSKYKEWEVNLPKGILLAGPPGTGKTLLVKTMADNLNIPIESMSGSEFVEMYVGVGASRVRKLFAKAKKHDKCIIFIDEIDAIGKKRGFDNNSERDNTLNQLLVEMDGFDETTNIIIFAATNLVKKLDSALTRSGRFDKKVYFDAPNFKERREMFKLYLEDIKLPPHLSFEILSERGAGLTGADIATICNQAKINAIQGKQLLSTLREEDLQEAIDEIMIGREKRERTMTKEEKERVSHHEAGHALMGYLLKDCAHPIKVSIVPRGEAALGFSQQKNENKKLFKENTILSRIAILLGGRTAEKIIYNNVSTGAADDIEKASSLIYNYTCSWGMNKHIGPLNPEVMGAVGRNLSEESFEECKQIMAEIEDYVFKTLKKHKKYVKSIAELLLKEETINYKQIKDLVPEKLENTLTVTIS
ncbi:AAA family ATPase [Crocinitomicaceae bacterium]|nr:AAA family ATPase [Crocinitomicaceae bacterium]